MVFGTVHVLSRRFPKHSRGCPQCGSLQDRLRKMRKHWRLAGCPDNGQCRQPAEGVTKFISASKFCSGPKSRRGKFTLSQRRRNAGKASLGDKDSVRNLSGICGEAAESCGFINFAFLVLSGPCPGPSGRLVKSGKGLFAFRWLH